MNKTSAITRRLVLAGTVGILGSPALDCFIGALESMKDWRDIFGGPALSLSATNHHASSQSFLSVVKNRRWTPVMDAALSF